ncbi:MAG TPA: hypothetical protein VNM15_06885 [Candidatus Binatia bacterium]|nr:hypothetical protein [Candidatus Binatia bacterium]
MAEPVAAEAIVGPEHFTALEFYQHVLKPLKLRYSVSVTLLRDEERLAAVAFLRSSEAGPFTAEELQILRAVAPHMQRALQLTLRLSKLETRSRGLFEALNAWRDGAVLVDGGGLAMFVNAAAGDILKCQYGLQLVKGRLAARDPVANAILDRTLRSALANVEGAAVKGAQALVVPRAGDGGQYNVFVLPLRLAPALFSSQTPAALIVISESPSESAPGAEILLLADFTERTHPISTKGPT